MLRGIETAAQGTAAILDWNDMMANNLANVNTTGFKKAQMIFKDIHEQALANASVNKQDQSTQNNRIIGNLSTGSTVDSIVIDFSQGGLQQTGNPLDLGINGQGFFKIQTADGIAYTRNGNFLLNKDGFLVNSNGDAVLDTSNSKIQIKLNNQQTKDINITGDGQIAIGQQKLQKLAVVDFTDKTQLESVGSTMFKPKDESETKPVQAKNFEVRQGSLEGSNASIIESMLGSINASRTYETLNNILKNTSETLQKSTGTVGRLRV